MEDLKSRLIEIEEFLINNGAEHLCATIDETIGYICLLENKHKDSIISGFTEKDHERFITKLVMQENK